MSIRDNWSLVRILKQSLLEFGEVSKCMDCSRSSVLQEPPLADISSIQPTTVIFLMLCHFTRKFRSDLSGLERKMTRILLSSLKLEFSIKIYFSLLKHVRSWEAFSEVKNYISGSDFVHQVEKLYLSVCDTDFTMQLQTSGINICWSKLSACRLP